MQSQVESMATSMTRSGAIHVSSHGEADVELRASAPSCSRTDIESDEAIAVRAQGGSLSAFGSLVDRYEKRLIGFLTQRAGGRHAAEDLAQETFVRAWRRLETFDAERRFSTWLFTIASRLAADEHRRRKRERKGSEEAERRSQAQASRQAVEINVIEDVWGVARSVLKPEQMEAMWLRYVMEMEIPDIATALGRSRVGTRVLLFRARERLAEVMALTQKDMSKTGPRRTKEPAKEKGS